MLLFISVLPIVSASGISVSLLNYQEDVFVIPWVLGTQNGRLSSVVLGKLSVKGLVLKLWETLVPLTKGSPRG